MKKLRRIQRRPGRGTLEDVIANAHSRKGAELCATCPNPMVIKSLKFMQNDNNVTCFVFRVQNVIISYVNNVVVTNVILKI